MRIQVLSDLHLETEDFSPQPAPGANLLVLAGDIDTTWSSLSLFANWPVPVVFVPGNHEFDGRDLDEALLGLRDQCRHLGIRLLEKDCWIATAPDGRRIRFVGTTRWSDFDLIRRNDSRAAGHACSQLLRQGDARHTPGAGFRPRGRSSRGLRCRDWLAHAIKQTPSADAPVNHAGDTTVVITHYGLSLQSADPRYGKQPGTASFLQCR